MPPFDSIELSGHIALRGEQRGYTKTQVRSCIERPDHSGSVQRAVDIYIKEADILLSFAKRLGILIEVVWIRVSDRSDGTKRFSKMQVTEEVES
jgi:hypothetical protein